jgi:hypothetical protein
MDFIEQLFGISSDGGAGSFEALLLLIPLAGLMLGVVRRRQPISNVRQ